MSLGKRFDTRQVKTGPPGRYPSNPLPDIQNSNYGDGVDGARTGIFAP